MRLELVAFDLYGTLLDVSGLAKRLEPYAGPQAADLLSSWRKAQLERTWREKAYEPFDMVTALEQWVERGTAPDQVIASHRTNGVVDRTRPLCPYPSVATYKGTGSTDEAANFVCKGTDDGGRKSAGQSDQD